MQVILQEFLQRPLRTAEDNAPLATRNASLDHEPRRNMIPELVANQALNDTNPIIRMRRIRAHRNDLPSNIHSTLPDLKLEV